MSNAKSKYEIESLGPELQREKHLKGSIFISPHQVHVKYLRNHVEMITSYIRVSRYDAITLLVKTM